MTLKEKIFESLHCTQWGANLIGWWHCNVENHRTKKDLLAYLKEADDKVWLMRTSPVEPNEYRTPEQAAEIETRRQAAVERILSTYDDIPEEGYEEWERGFWMGVLGTLRWVLGDEEKDNLDT